MKKETCKTCKREFIPNRKERIYCSKKCAGKDKGFEKGQIAWNDKNNKVICKFCGIEFKTSPSWNRKFCSQLCYFNCEKGKRHSFKTEFKKGFIPWNKGKCSGKTDLRHMIGNLTEYKEWRKSVYQRDDYTCQLCGERGFKLNGHHKKRFKEIVKKYNIKNVKDALICEELWDINNGVTLCEKCHKIMISRVIWISGNSGSGKTYLAQKLRKIKFVIWLDGDMIRKIWTDLGFSKKDRIENNLRIARMALEFKNQGFDLIISTICPYKKLREEVKEITGCRFIYLEGGVPVSEEFPYEK